MKDIVKNGLLLMNVQMPKLHAKTRWGADGLT